MKKVSEMYEAAGPAFLNNKDIVISMAYNWNWSKPASYNPHLAFVRIFHGKARILPRKKYQISI